MPGSRCVCVCVCVRACVRACEGVRLCAWHDVCVCEGVCVAGMVVAGMCAWHGCVSTRRRHVDQEHTCTCTYM